MFKNFAKISTVMALVVSAMAMLAAAAGASTWHSNRGGTYGGVAYGGAFAASSSQASSLTVSSAGSTVTLSCTAATATGTLATGTTTTAGTSYSSGTGLASGSVSFTPCTSAGVPGYSVSGTYSLNGTSTSAATYAGAAGRTVSGALGSLSLTVFAPGSRACDTVSGSVNGTYTNPSTLTGTPPTGTSTSTDARLVVSAGSLTVTNTLSGCALPSGTGSYTGQTFGLTSSSPQPVIWFG